MNHGEEQVRGLGLGLGGRFVEKMNEKIKENLEMRGIDPRTSRMLSERSTI